MKTLKNLVKYRVIQLPSQVDPEVMRPIIEDNLRKLSFYSDEDGLEIWKEDKDSLNFRYSSYMDTMCYTDGTIRHQKKRKGFEEVDPSSIIEIPLRLSKDENKKHELSSALVQIALDGDIDMISEQQISEIFENKSTIQYYIDLKNQMETKQ